MTLEDLGWNDAFEREFAPYRANGWLPARLIRDNRISYGALTEDGDEFEAILAGKVYHEAETDAELPAVGDWVALDPNGEDGEAVIRARLTRQSCLSRRAPGHSAEEQVISANVTTVLVITDAGADLNPRRMERYFALIGRSGARAVVLVNKADLFPAAQTQEAVEAIRALHPEVEIHIGSVEKRKGLKPLRALLKKGETLALVGSSGVGKSALVNYFLGDEWQWTGEVNEVTGKGRHTTTARELIVLPRGGMLVDNPGMREVQMWTDEATLREAFADIEALTAECRFHDCKHGSDAGCAIRAAVEAGQLGAERYRGFLKLDEEIEKLRTKRKKRQMTVERIAKRSGKTKLRNRSDRQELALELRPRA